MQPDTWFQLPGSHVLGEVIDGEAIVVNLESGAYYSLQDAGGLVWSLATAGVSRSAIVGVVVQRYIGGEGEIAAAVDRLLAELVDEGLIEPAGELDGASPPPTSLISDPPAGVPFVAPVLARYTDMADLLLLDPIHEVGELGWPQLAESTPKD